MHPIIAEMFVTSRQQDLARARAQAGRGTATRRHGRVRRRHDGLR